MNCVLHVDEIFLKGANQPFFYRTLIKNLKDIFPGATANRIEGAIWLENFNEADLGILMNFPGIANFAPAARCDADLSVIGVAVDKLCQAQTADSFRITATRSNKSFAQSSTQLEKVIGQQVVDKYGWKVNLEKPDLEIHVDIARAGAAVYGNLTNGAGGLPVGTTGKILCLLSGGIDSPVAAYEMMKRGARVELVHFMNQTRVSEQVGEKIFDLAKVLARYQGETKLFIVPYGELQRQVVMKVPAAYRMLINRRLFLRIAEKIASREKCLALVTGDSLGQVASQTLENLAATQSAVEILKLSPLIGRNKRDITNIARAIGTLDISNRPYEDCCSMFVAKHPETKAKLSAVKKIEEGMDLSTLDKILPISYYIGSN